MAISWDISITNVNVVSKRADVTFTRTDDGGGQPVWSNTYTQAVIETTPQRTALLDLVWAAWQTELTKRTNIASFLSTLEQTGKANLEARET